MEKGKAVNLKHFSKREKILGLITTGCLLAWMAGQVCFNRLHDAFETLDQETIRLQQELHKNQVFLGRQIQVEDEFRRALDLVGDKADDQDLMTHMLANVNATAQARKIQLQELNAMPMNKAEGIRTIKIKISLAGSWTSLLEFLNELQKSPHRFDMEDIVLEKSQAGEHLVRCQMTITRWSLEEVPL
jgi:Tfp pilus assembly protein PilO